jgi:hypothetical protein
MMMIDVVESTQGGLEVWGHRGPWNSYTSAVLARPRC